MEYGPLTAKSLFNELAISNMIDVIFIDVSKAFKWSWQLGAKA
jgi:hypothetical protein